MPPAGEPSFGLLARQQTYSGFGDALAQAFEMVVTPLLFGVGGYFLDRWLGTSPLFTIILSLLGIVGMSAKMWYAYDARMRAHEATAPWATAPPAVASTGRAQPERERA
ncbi:MAG: AtpZ/AtpI family protein [Acidimicrobiales bacterium]